MNTLSAALRNKPYLLALLFGGCLLLTNIIALPGFAAPGQIAGTLGGLAPFAVAGMASTPAFLAGGGGIDLSIAPLMGLVNIVFVSDLAGTRLGSPLLAVPICLAIGAAVGAVNGTLIAVLRFPPVIATLCTFFIVGGVDLKLAPAPVTLATNWTGNLAGSIAGIPGAALTIGLPLLLWFTLGRTPFLDTMLAVGDDEAAAYSAGVNVTRVRILAYTLGGLLAAVAGLALTGLIRSADATTPGTYTLIALGAVALGGTNLAGGRGGIGGAALGASAIFLLQSVLAALHVSAYWLQVAYGTTLIAALLAGAALIGRKQVAVP